MFEIRLNCVYKGDVDPRKDAAIQSVIKRYTQGYIDSNEGIIACGRFLGRGRDRFFTATLNNYVIDRDKVEAELRTAGCDLVDWEEDWRAMPKSFKRSNRAIEKMVAAKANGRSLAPGEWVRGDTMCEFGAEESDLLKLVLAASKIVEEEFATRGTVQSKYVLSRLGAEQPDILLVPDDKSEAVLNDAIAKGGVVCCVFVQYLAPVVAFVGKDVRGLSFGGMRELWPAPGLDDTRLS